MRTLSYLAVCNWQALVIYKTFIGKCMLIPFITTFQLQLVRYTLYSLCNIISIRLYLTHEKCPLYATQWHFVTGNSHHSYIFHLFPVNSRLYALLFLLHFIATDLQTLNRLITCALVNILQFFCSYRMKFIWNRQWKHVLKLGYKLWNFRLLRKSHVFIYLLFLNYPKRKSYF